MRRLRLLEEAGAAELKVFSDDADAELAAGRRRAASPCAPSPVELAQAQLVFVAGCRRRSLPRWPRRRARWACIVHVEDDPALSDTRRRRCCGAGALTLAVSTGGASPALAVQLRDFLGDLFGPEWHERLDELSRQRRAWRKAGAAPETIAQLTGEWVRGRGWLPARATRH